MFTRLPLALAFGTLLMFAASCRRGHDARSAQDASGNLLFNPAPLKHAPETPFWCFSEVKDAHDQTECAGLEEWCGRSLGYSKEAGRSITGGCHQVPAVACYTVHVDSDQTLCMATMDECTQATARDKKTLGGPGSVSDCVALDRSFKH